MFVAVIPPAEVIEDLEEFLEPRREAGPDLRWTDPEQLHLTLAFLPEVSPASVDRLIYALGERLASVPALAVRLAEGGAFPNPYAARVLFAGVAGAEGRLESLARAARGGCVRAGAGVDGGRFHPHVTIARSKRPLEATRWIRVLQAYDGPGWVADEVALIESHLGGGRGRRPRYERVATVPLASA